MKVMCFGCRTIVLCVAGGLHSRVVMPDGWKLIPMRPGSPAKVPYCPDCIELFSHVLAELDT